MYLDKRIVVQFMDPGDQVLPCLFDFLHGTDQRVWGIGDDRELCIQSCRQRRRCSDVGEVHEWIVSRLFCDFTDPVSKSRLLDFIH